MAQITSSVGLISGINTSQIISELISLDAQPITLLQNRISSANAQTQAYQSLASQLQSLQQIGQALELPTTFASATATASNPAVLSATAATGAALGTYNFNVASLVTSQQSISNGYSSANATLAAGAISISQGGGEATSQTTLAQLNGGAGVTRGQFRITDGSGNSAVIDASTAVTLDDVVNSINSALGVSVKASIVDDHLVLKDASGQNKNHFTVSDIGNGATAQQLGIVGSTSGGGTITGSSINTISASTPLAQLNDGRGVATASGAPDFQINLSDGTSVQVALGSAQTVGDVLSAINKVGGVNLHASLDTANNGIQLTDATGGSGTFSVTPLNGSSAAADLGIHDSTSGTTLGGKTLLASLDSVLISSLNGGSGLSLGTVRFTDRNGAVADLNLSGATSLQDILDNINSSGLAIKASINQAGDGIQLQDTSNGGQRNIVVTDLNSTTASQLGIAGTFDTSTNTIQGADLHTQYVSNSTLLSSYNGGKGVTPGSFVITNSKGVAATINLSQGTFNTIGDVIKAINAKQIGVTASINANGDGIKLDDSAGGSSELKVSEAGSTTASDLNLLGTATNNVLDGSLTKTIAVTNTDTLATVQQKIKALGWGVSANIVSDGSSVNGFHLALTALNTGRDGRFVFDGGATGLNAENVVQAQNASVFYGGAGSSNSLLITSSSNQLAGVIPGVTVQLQGTGSTSLTVAPDSSGVSTQLQTFATTYNAVVNQLNTLTQWNTTTSQAGLLLGDSTAQDIQQQLAAPFSAVVNGAGQFKLLSDVGFSVNGDGTIAFDPTKFSSSYASDPTAVQNLFTQTTTGLGTVIDKSLNNLVDPVSGSVTQEEATIALQIQGWQSDITDLNTLLADQQNTLQTQFANMESTLATLQAQGAQLANINVNGFASASSSSSSSSKSSSSGGGTSSSSGG